MRCTCLSILLIATAFPAPAGFDTRGWEWQSRLPANAAPAGFVRLSLTPEILDRSAPALQDLRIRDGAGELAPYVFYAERVAEQRVEKWQDLRLIDRTYREGEYARVVLDFGKAAEKNRIRVVLAEDQYCRRLSLEGSHDNQTWETVVEGKWVFRLKQDGKDFEMNTVEFPVNTFRYLRLTVFAAPDQPAAPEIRSTQSAMTKSVPGKERIPVPVSITSVVHDPKKKCSVYELDLGYRNLPIMCLEAAFSDPYFYRGYELLGRNAITERVQGPTDTDMEERKASWRSIRSGVVYRVHDQRPEKDAQVAESGPIENLQAPYRYLQLRIHNGDNPPLTLDGTVTAYRRDVGLVFDYNPAETYSLCFGNAQAPSVKFDLALAVKDVAERDLPRIAPGDISPLEPVEVKKLWSERHPMLIWAALIVGVAAMLGLIGINLKKLRPAGP